MRDVSLSWVRVRKRFLEEVDLGAYLRMGRCLESKADLELQCHAFETNLVL